MSNQDQQTKPDGGASVSTAMLERRRFEEWANGSIGRTWRKTEPGYENEYADSHTQIAWMAWINAVQSEREACAKECDELATANARLAKGSCSGMYYHMQSGNEECAEAIRMRSNAPHEGADAALSRTLPLDAVVGAHGTTEE